jgi:hypothetical protein
MYTQENLEAYLRFRVPQTIVHPHLLQQDWKCVGCLEQTFIPNMFFTTVVFNRGYVKTPYDYLFCHLKLII